jgi:hypothetical protein
LREVRAIDDWTGAGGAVPLDLTNEDVTSAVEIARYVRDRGRELTWSSSEITLDEAGAALIEREGKLRIEKVMEGNLFGRPVPLGYSRSTSRTSSSH